MCLTHFQINRCEFNVPHHHSDGQLTEEQLHLGPQMQKTANFNKCKQIQI